MLKAIQGFNSAFIWVIGMTTQNELRDRMDNRIIEAQIFERKSLDGRLSEAKKLHYIKVAQTAREEARILMNELFGWSDELD
jgi:hypothetical protein